MRLVPSLATTARSAAGAAALALVPAGRASAQPACHAGSLASYTAIAATGCTIDGVRFDGFYGYLIQSDAGSPIPLSPSVTITPTSTALADGRRWLGFQYGFQGALVANTFGAAPVYGYPDARMTSTFSFEFTPHAAYSGVRIANTAPTYIGDQDAQFGTRANLRREESLWSGGLATLGVDAQNSLSLAYLYGGVGPVGSTLCYSGAVVPPTDDVWTPPFHACDDGVSLYAHSVAGLTARYTLDVEAATPIDPSARAPGYVSASGGASAILADAPVAPPVTTTPEPASAALLGVGALGLAVAARRRTRLTAIRR